MEKSKTVSRFGAPPEVLAQALVHGRAYVGIAHPPERTVEFRTRLGRQQPIGRPFVESGD